MECTVRNASDGIGDESRLMELEKLQRLVQTLQEKNDQLMAAVGSGAAQNDDHLKRTANAVDPPRDSGIDLSASCSEELEDDLLDLDRFDMPDDEESWLYSTPSAKSQGDVLSWLRKDINSLDPAARRALAIKLEMLIAKKQNDALKKTSADSKDAPTENALAQGNYATPISPIGILEFPEEGILSTEPAFETEGLLSPEWEPNRVIARRTTFKVDRKHSGGEAAAAAAAAAAGNGSPNNMATYNRPKKASLTSTKPSNEQTLAFGSGGQKTPQQQQQHVAATPALTVTDDPATILASVGISPGRKLTFEAIHTELNPNLHDIQLLASMQEEELRRCLQNLQQMNRRRRTSSGNQKEGEASPVTPHSNTNGNANAAAVPVIPAKASDRYATYTKPKQQQLVAMNAANGVSTDFPAASKPSSVSGRKIASSTVPSQPLQIPSSHDAAISVQKVTGLQKSLPNLSGSKSEFNLPMPSFPVDTSSEKGSYGDIPSALNPPSRGQVTASSTPRLMGAGSRLPTPARSRLPTPAKSGIPLARTGQSLPVPVSNRQRTKSPGIKQSVSSLPKNHPANGSWNEGCF